MASFFHQRKSSLGATIPLHAKCHYEWKIQPHNHLHSPPIHHTLYDPLGPKIHFNSPYHATSDTPQSHFQVQTAHKTKIKEPIHSHHQISSQAYQNISPRDMACNVTQLTDVDISTGLFILRKCISDYCNAFRIKKLWKFELSHYWVTFTGVLDYRSEDSARIQGEGQQKIVISMVQQLLKICSHGFQDFVKYFQRSTKGRTVGFKYMLSLINSYQFCAKIRPIDRIPKKYICANSPISTRNTSQRKPYSRHFFSDDKGSRNQRSICPTNLFKISEDIQSARKPPKFLAEIAKRERIRMKKGKNKIHTQYFYKIEPITEVKHCKISTTSTKGSDQYKKSMLSCQENRNQTGHAEILWRKLQNIQKDGPLKSFDQNISAQCSLFMYKLEKFPEHVHEVQSEGTMSEAELERSYVIYSDRCSQQEKGTQKQGQKEQNQPQGIWKKKIKRLINDSSNQIKQSIMVEEEKKNIR